MGDPEEKRTNYSFEEYIEMEAAREERLEYHFGEIFALAGSTKRHYRIAKRTIDLLEAQLVSKPCEVFGSDIKLELVERGKYVYPDITMTCEPSDLSDDLQMIINRPALIVEVLSDSTEAYDRNDKFKSYIKIPSLKHYVLISQYQYQVECYSRQSHDFWHYRSFTKGDAVIDFPDLDCKLNLDNIYEGISLAEPD